MPHHKHTTAAIWDTIPRTPHAATPCCQVLGHPRAIKALSTRINDVREENLGSQFEVRLHKYTQRGFAVAVPQLQRDRIDEGIYTEPLFSCDGLAKLLKLESEQPVTGDAMKSSDRDGARSCLTPRGRILGYSTACLPTFPRLQCRTR